MMLRRVSPVVLFATVALAAPLAHGEIYTWVDAAGVTNVSNLPPPDGAKLTKVQHALPPEILAREDAARDAAQRAEAQALAARVQQLEEEARQAPPPDYRPVMPPPVIQYIVQAPQPPMQQTVEVTPAYAGNGYGGYGYAGYGCDPSWFACWWPGFYPASVIVVDGSHSNKNRPIHHGQNMNGPRLPPPFGPPLVPNAGPSQPQRFVQRFVPSAMGFKRG
ncbi:MAG TPA: DUF4124 domain-containing protein [Casimicrobiaceae bacterium]|nr:DUF4124 domain-containing protein [Casimicrobiaceae bacterium]